jgi:hypothetical protein
MGLDGIVSFGKALNRYENAPGGGVTAHFADGSQATGDVRNPAWRCAVYLI